MENDLTIENLFLETPLYEEVPLDNMRAYSFAYRVIHFDKTIDAYCPGCRRSSTFRGLQENPTLNKEINQYASFDSLPYIIKEEFNNKIYRIDLRCARSEKHLMYFLFNFIQGLDLDSGITIPLKTKNSLIKIGQFPSLANLSQPGLHKYREVLSEEKYKEFNRGNGLVTHGVGIGAFVYLRRIFEDLIEEAHLKLIEESEWNEEVYQKSRVDEKIDILKKVLPKFLVENKHLYSILSKGIHELSEEECLKYFPTVKVGIELILDEKLENKRRETKIELAKKSINQIHSDLSNE